MTKNASVFPDPHKDYICNTEGYLVDWEEVFSYLIDLTNCFLKWYELNMISKITMNLREYREIIWAYWEYEEGDPRRKINPPSFGNFRSYLLRFETTICRESDQCVNFRFLLEPLSKPNVVLFGQLLLILTRTKQMNTRLGHMRKTQDDFNTIFTKKILHPTKEYIFTLQVDGEFINTMLSMYAFGIHRKWDIASLTQNGLPVVRMLTKDKIYYFYRNPKLDDMIISLFKTIMRLSVLNIHITPDKQIEFGTIDIIIDRFHKEQYILYEDAIKTVTLTYLPPRLNPVFLTLSEIESFCAVNERKGYTKIIYRFTNDSINPIQTNTIPVSPINSDSKNNLSILL